MGHRTGHGGKDKQKKLNDKRDKENKEQKKKQDAFDKKHNTQKFRAETSEAGGKFRTPGGGTITLPDKETAIRQGIARARERNTAIRKFDKLSKEDKKKLIQESGDPRSADNEKIGPGVSYRGTEDQARVKAGFVERIDDYNQKITNTFYDNRDRRPIKEQFGFEKTRAASYREQAEMITRGEIDNFFIGADRLNNITAGPVREQERISTEQQKIKTGIFPSIYSDEKGKEIFTITGQSKDSKFSYTIRDKEKEKDLNKFLSGSDSKPDTNEIFPFPLQATQTPKPKSWLDSLEAAKQSTINIGVDITSAAMIGGVSKYTEPLKEKLLGFRKETPVDLILQPDRWGEINVVSPEFLGSVSPYVATLLLNRKMSPLKLERTTIPTKIKPGIPVLGKPTGSENIYTGLNVGYGRFSKYVFGTTSEGKILVGKPNPTRISLDKFVPPSSRGGFAISEETSGLLTTKPFLAEFVRLGKITPSGSKYIQDVKRGLKITEGIPDVVIRTDLGKTPFASLKAGKETKKFTELVTSKQKSKVLPAAKGSIIQQYYTTQKYFRKSRDLDIQLVTKKQELKGLQTVKSFEMGLQKVADPGRKFTAKKLHLEVSGKGRSPDKVLELLTKDSSKGSGYPSLNPMKVFGMKVPMDKVKPKDIETLTYRFQGLRKGTSITESTPKGIMPAKGREKDIFDYVGYLTTKAEQVGGKKGLELKTIAKDVKSYAKHKRIWTAGGKESTVFEISPSKTAISNYVSLAVKGSKPSLIVPSVGSPYIKSKEITSKPLSIPISKPISKAIDYKINSKPFSKPISKPISNPGSKPTNYITSNPLSKLISKPIVYQPPPSKPITSRPVYSRPVTSKPIVKSPPQKLPPSEPIIITEEPIIPIKPIVLPTNFKTRKEKRYEIVSKGDLDFIGNMPLAQVEGIFRGWPDITLSDNPNYKWRLNKAKNYQRPKSRVERGLAQIGYREKRDLNITEEKTSGKSSKPSTKRKAPKPKFNDKISKVNNKTTIQFGGKKKIPIGSKSKGVSISKGLSKIKLF